MTDDMLTGEADDFYSFIRATITDDLGITADTTDDEVHVIADAEETEARNQGQIVTGVYAYLRALRDTLTQEERER